MTIYTKKNVIHFRTPFLILFDAIYVKGIKSVVNVYVVLNYFLLWSAHLKISEYLFPEVIY